MTHRLEEIRKSKGITQIHVAMQLGYKYSSHYNKIEKDKSYVPRLDMAYKLSRILDVSISELFPDEKNLA